MATLRSATDWTGREVNGVVLGDPARANADGTGDYLWDHPGIPGDQIDENGDIWMEVEDAQNPA